MEVLKELRDNLDLHELRLVEMARRRGVAWAQIARRLGHKDGAAVQKRLIVLRERPSAGWRLQILGERAG